ncbi:MAG: filamentous hemagglutinin N-terminal domain-containing protein, partial [Bacteroidota bacterium]
MPSPHRLLTKWMVALLWLFPGQLLQGQPLQVDTNISSAHRPQIETGPDDKTPVVNITAPGADGVSRNVFEEYNVGEEGIIYNNNPDGEPGTPGAFPPSYLAQFPLMVNPHLNGHAARVILTEVSGFNPSLLQGYTEIYGRRADYILANPNGIYADGAGFINTHRITLTTGLPQWSARGGLRGFSVRRGVVEIRGKGMVTNVPNLPSSPLAIISRVAKLSSQLWSPDEVSIYTGCNDFNYHTQEAVPRSGSTTDRPHLAIDASLLGNIQAGKITLIATEEGVGVKAPAMLSAGGDITLQAAGPVSLPKAVQSHQNISVTSDDLLALSG